MHRETGTVNVRKTTVRWTIQKPWVPATTPIAWALPNASLSVTPGSHGAVGIWEDSFVPHAGPLPKFFEAVRGEGQRFFLEISFPESNQPEIILRPERRTHLGW